MAGGFLNTTYFVRHFDTRLSEADIQIGSIFSSWLCFAMVYFPGGATNNWSWRIPTLLQGIGPVILAIGVFFVPQSPRWLINNGRVDEAHRILATYHANGDLQDPLVVLELQEISAGIEIEALAKSGTWLSFFRTAGNRRRFFVIIMIGTATQWIGNGLVSYFLVPILRQVGITQPAQTTGINGGIAIWSWWAAMLGASLSDKFGRRSLFLTSLTGCLASFIFITALSGTFASTGNSATGISMIPFLFLFNAFYAIAFTPIPLLYVPEISSYSLRAKSAALLLLSQNVAQAFNQFVNPVALAAIAWRYFIVYVAVIGFYIVVFYLFCRETKGLTVEESATVYDRKVWRRKDMAAASTVDVEAVRQGSESDKEADDKVEYEHEEKRRVQL
jgi:hypothetical protein